MKQLIVYPNFSKGGVTSVIRGRAAANPDTLFHVVFFNDRGGRDAFTDMPNVSARIVRKDRAPAHITYLAATHGYQRISILSSPEVASKAEYPKDAQVVYEFHTSNMKIIERELKQLDLSKVSSIAAPSTYMSDQIRGILPPGSANPVEVVPNLVDRSIFFAGPPVTSYLADGSHPLLWVGRFDREKGYRYFLRALGMLPSDYRGIVVVSIESDPARAAEFLGEAAACGVLDRVDILANVPQRRMGEIFREAASKGGAMISTSLLESFGYSVLEALYCGLPTFAFELPPFHEHPDPNNLLRMVDVGDASAIAEAILTDTPQKI